MSTARRRQVPVPSNLRTPRAWLPVAVIPSTSTSARQWNVVVVHDARVSASILVPMAPDSIFIPTTHERAEQRLTLLATEPAPTYSPTVVQPTAETSTIAHPYDGPTWARRAP